MNRILASFVLATLTTSAFAQSNTNSPYSQFGLGDLTDQSVSFNKGMNGVGLAMRRGNEVNPMNPASYSSIDSLTFLFDAGMSGQITNYNENGKKFNGKSGGFDYVTALFRAFKNVGISFGVLPSTDEKRVERYRDAEDECYGFINEFPESKNVPTAEKYIAKCKRVIKD